MLTRIDFRLLLGLVLAICFFQFPRGYDVQNYFWGARDAYTSAFATPPYPTAPVGQGAFFQSPVVTVLCLPFSWLPTWWGKLAWASLNLAAIGLLLRLLLREALCRAAKLFLLLVFTYPLSDVFLSGNINFPLLVACVAGWHFLIEKEGRLAGLTGGLLIALAVFIKPIALVFVPWLALRAPKKLAPVVLGLLAWLGLTGAVMGRAHFSPWWGGWLKAMSFYPLAADPGRVAFQSPPAALFRLLGAYTSFSFGMKLLLVQLVGVLIMAGLLLLAASVNGRRAGALLFASLFLGTPFSWACTILFLFPLLAQYVREGDVSAIAWALAVIFALAQKAILPGWLWEIVAPGSLHALLLMVLATLGVARVIRPELRDFDAGFGRYLRALRALQRT